MRLESISASGYVSKVLKLQAGNLDNQKTNSDYPLNHAASTISHFPKSYIKFSPAFKASLEEERAMQKEIQDQKLINDYLWAKSWDPKRARDIYDQKTSNEIRRRDAEAFAYLKNSTIQSIINKYDTYYNDEKELYDKMMEKDNVDYCERLLKENIKIRPKSSSEILRNTKGTINSKIAGYSALKDDMNEVFILPATQELLNGGEKKVKNGILLCGPTGCGKTIAAEAIANETYCFVDRIQTNTDPREFENVLYEKINESKKRYKQKQEELYNFRNSYEFACGLSEELKNEKLKKIGSPRTVILIDEFDRYFNPISVEKETIAENINAVKTMFDGCAEFPKEENANAAAVTFICTTNYPKRIPIGEDININKLTPYAVLPPAGEDMEDVIRHYLNLGNIIMYDHKKQGNGQLKEVDVKNINLKKFVKEFGPSEKDGAFSNDAIGSMVTKAMESYIDNPKFDFNIYLLREFKYALKDIRPEKLEKYQSELNRLGLIDTITFEKIDLDNSSRKEIVEKKIKNLTIVPEAFLTPKQKEELHALRAELDELNNN